jgi:hypothetical protein
MIVSKNLYELYELLKNICETHQIDDIEIKEANEEDENDFICCDQKIIHYVDGYYDVSCLYNEHPTYKFKTKEEVEAFFNGCFELMSVFKKEKSEIDLAYNLGLFTERTLIMRFCFNQNKDKYKEFLSDKQYNHDDNTTYKLDLTKLPNWFEL